MYTYRPNLNVFHIPDLGRNLTDEDIVAFYAAGLPLPCFAHGPRSCEADYYAADDRRDARLMRLAMSQGVGKRGLAFVGLEVEPL